MFFIQIKLLCTNRRCWFQYQREISTFQIISWIFYKSVTLEVQTNMYFVFFIEFKCFTSWVIPILRSDFKEQIIFLFHDCDRTRFCKTQVIGIRVGWPRRNKSFWWKKVVHFTWESDAEVWRERRKIQTHWSTPITIDQWLRSYWQIRYSLQFWVVSFSLN